MRAKNILHLRRALILSFGLMPLSVPYNLFAADTQGNGDLSGQVAELKQQLQAIAADYSRPLPGGLDSAFKQETWNKASLSWSPSHYDHARLARIALDTAQLVETWEAKDGLQKTVQNPRRKAEARLVWNATTQLLRGLRDNLQTTKLALDNHERVLPAIGEQNLGKAMRFMAVSEGFFQSMAGTVARLTPVLNSAHYQANREDYDAMRKEGKVSSLGQWFAITDSKGWWSAPRPNLKKTAWLRKALDRRTESPSLRVAAHGARELLSEMRPEHRSAVALSRALKRAERGPLHVKAKAN